MANLNLLGNQMEKIQERRRLMLSRLVDIAMQNGKDDVGAWKWANQTLTKDPQAKEDLRQFNNYRGMANDIQKKAGLVTFEENVAPPAGSDFGDEQELDSFLVGAGVRKPGGQVAAGGVAASAPTRAPAPIYDPTSVPGMGLQGPPGPAPMTIQPGMSGSPYADPYLQIPASTPLDQATLEDLAARGIIRLR
jgi:hypothetical protein